MGSGIGAKGHKGEKEERFGGKKWEERIHRIEEVEKESGEKLAEMEKLAEKDRYEQDKELS